MHPEAIYVEYLTIGNWLRIIAPALRCLAKGSSQHKPRCYIFDSTTIALWLAYAWGRWKGIHVERPCFQIIDMRDEQGLAIFIRVIYLDPSEIQTLILKNADFQTFTRGLDPTSYASAYLAKTPITFYDFNGPEKYKQIWHVTMMTQIARWYERQSNNVSPSFSLYINQRPWMKELKQYAQSYGGLLHSLGTVQLLRWRWAGYKAKVKKLNWRLLKTLVRHKIFGLKAKCGLAKSRPYFSIDAVRILTENYGQLNLDYPQCHSDVFFADGKGVSLRDILLIFNSALDPIDARKYKLLSSHGLAAVALTPQSCAVEPSLIEVFRPHAQASKESLDYLPLERMNEEIKTLKADLIQYHNLRSYWRQFFQQYNIKLYSCWAICEPRQMALADAIMDVGGVSTIYQRSYEPNPSPQVNSGADIIFGFSPQNFTIRRDDGSLFRYHVATGYTGDYRFELVRPKAIEIRHQLKTQGAKHIIAYFDEETKDDGRWFVGHQVAQKNYRFLLEKLLAEPQLGLVLKPKEPITLRRRLGEVSKLLMQAENTGRCFIFEGGVFQGIFPPAAAALAADVSIHDTLSSGTAGLESALAGTKTILLDYEGWPLSPLYKLGPEVVFRDWESAWQACREYFQDPGNRPRFGDWSGMIHEIDPFHDGRAAERISWYLKELLEGLRRGDRPVDIMERTAENYAGRWGKDKVQYGPRR